MAFADPHQKYPDVYFDVIRIKSIILEGLAEDVSAAKDVLLSFDIKQQCLSLTFVETGIVVGNKGIFWGL